MAVARIEPVNVRRYNPAMLRAPRAYPPAIPTRRLLVLGLVAAGALVQHSMVTTPLEPQPAPLPLAAAGLARPPVAPAVPVVPVVPAVPVVPVAVSARGGHTARAALVRDAGLLARRVAALPPVPATRTGLPYPAAAVRLLPSAPAVPGAAHRPAVILPPVGVFGDHGRVAMASNPQGAIVHLPSVSVSAIRTALAAAGSPLLSASYADHKDAAEYIWDAGRILGVDPAVVMAIFHHESVFGTRGMARITNSIGNIRPLAGQPQVDGYRLYRSWQEGIDDCYRLLRQYARGGAGTVPLAIPVWAPPSDNNDDSAYIGSVLGTMSALYAASIGR